MRGAPQRGLAKLISRMSRRTSRGTLGLPARLRDFHRHKMRKPARCQRTIVSGPTMATEPRTDGANRYSQTRIRRSNMLRAGRLGAFRRSTFNCCRSAITSASSEPRDRNRSSSIHLIRLKSSVTRDVFARFGPSGQADGIYDRHPYLTSRRERKKIEMLFAHLKRILQLGRLRLRGPNGARDEFHLAATAQNLRKLAKLRSPAMAIA